MQGTVRIEGARATPDADSRAYRLIKHPVRG